MAHYGEPTELISSPSTTDPVTMMAMWGQMKDFDWSKVRGFEGPEKRLEVIMKINEFTAPNGLRSLPQKVWEDVVGVLNAQIVSRVSNDFLDSYVLTESSLFVFPDRCILITCGTTTLLDSLSPILNAISEVRGEVKFATFMRKNFSYPWDQRGPHSSMETEYDLLKKAFPSGKPYVLGPVDSDHYFFFVYDNVPQGSVEADTQMSMTMYGLTKDLTKHLFSEEFHPTGEETEKIREASRLSAILNGWTVQDLQFAPCGYSVNAIREGEYQTMHITPEDHCSFSSYETNTAVDDLSERLGVVLDVFKPQRFTVIVHIDPESKVGLRLKEGKSIGIEAQYCPEYDAVNRTVNEFSEGYTVIKLNYVRKEASAAQATAQ